MHNKSEKSRMRTIKGYYMLLLYVCGCLFVPMMIATTILNLMGFSYQYNICFGLMIGLPIGLLNIFISLERTKVKKEKDEK